MSIGKILKLKSEERNMKNFKEQNKDFIQWSKNVGVDIEGFSRQAWEVFALIKLQEKYADDRRITAALNVAPIAVLENYLTARKQAPATAPVEGNK